MKRRPWFATLFSAAAGLSAAFSASGGQVFAIATNNADTSVSIASDGTNYLVGIQGDYAGTNSYYVTAQLFGPSGALIGPRIDPVPGHTGGNPFVAGSGSSYLMVWPDDYLGGENSSLSGQLISPAGALLGGVIAITTNSQQRIQSMRPMAFGGGKYLVTWDDHREGTNWGIYGQLVSSEGSLVGASFVVSSPTDGQDEKGAAVDFDGTNFLVVWQHNSTAGGNHYVTYGVFISPSGSVGSPFAISETVSLDRNPLTVAFNGAEYLVVWNSDFQRDGVGMPLWNLYGRLVTPTGSFLGDEFTVVTNGNPTFPGLAFDGANYLLDWNQGGLFSPSASVQARFLNSSGQPAGPQFTPFDPQHGQVPLLAPLLYDGRRFVSSATLSSSGWLATNNAGIYGRFIPASSSPPQLAIGVPLNTNQISISLAGTPGIDYSIEATTNLTNPNWKGIVVESPTNDFFAVSLTDAGSASLGRFYRAISLGAPWQAASSKFVWIPPGQFLMGSPTTEQDRLDFEGPQTEVILPRGFYMNKFLVTQGEYLAMMGTNTSYFKGDSNRPVEACGWYNATNYCWRLTVLESQAGRLPAGWTYRLPTEAEFEYACRAGTTTRFFYGDDPGYTNLTNYGWYDANCFTKDKPPGASYFVLGLYYTSQPVGHKPPNPWGLYDMNGDVSEWCQDWFGSYPGGTLIDPQGPATAGIIHERIIRNGSWLDGPGNLRSAYRESAPPGNLSGTFGFRLVLAPSRD